ncbi:MAG: tryptophan synthase subunit alpha [Spirochaetia bacterium]|nr:tryptophan synthase subunit alpha [Spirochaetia bacterium]
MNLLQEYIEKINRKRPLYMPYLTIGDPDRELTVRFAVDIIDAGADILELGIPFSDPTADGPVIEAAMVRSLSKEAFSMDLIFDTAEKIHKERPLIPLVFLGYLNPILHYHNNGKMDSQSIENSIQAFMKKCRSSGVQGIVIPDLPFDQPESAFIQKYGKEYGVSQIMLIAPNTSDTRIREISRNCGGFVYYVTSMGVTGERKTLPSNIKKNIAKVRKICKLPVFAGFGISSPEHVKMLKNDVQGIIVGSLNHSTIQEYGDKSSEKLKEITSNFMTELKKW